jgi:hypothetical protein
MAKGKTTTAATAVATQKKGGRARTLKSDEVALLLRQLLAFKPSDRFKRLKYTGKKTKLFANLCGTTEFKAYQAKNALLKKLTAEQCQENFDAASADQQNQFLHAVTNKKDPNADKEDSPADEAKATGKIEFFHGDTLVATADGVDEDGEYKNLQLVKLPAKFKLEDCDMTGIMFSSRDGQHSVPGYLVDGKIVLWVDKNHETRQLIVLKYGGFSCITLLKPMAGGKGERYQMKVFDNFGTYGQRDQYLATDSETTEELILPVHLALAKKRYSEDNLPVATAVETRLQTDSAEGETATQRMMAALDMLHAVAKLIQKGDVFTLKHHGHIVSNALRILQNLVVGTYEEKGAESKEEELKKILLQVLAHAATLNAFTGIPQLVSYAVGKTAELVECTLSVSSTNDEQAAIQIADKANGLINVEQHEPFTDIAAAIGTMLVHTLRRIPGNTRNELRNVLPKLREYQAELQSGKKNAGELAVMIEGLAACSSMHEENYKTHLTVAASLVYVFGLMAVSKGYDSTEDGKKEARNYFLDGVVRIYNLFYSAIRNIQLKQNTGLDSVAKLTNLDPKVAEIKPAIDQITAIIKTVRLPAPKSIKVAGVELVSDAPKSSTQKKGDSKAFGSPHKKDGFRGRGGGGAGRGQGFNRGGAGTQSGRGGTQVPRGGGGGNVSGGRGGNNGERWNGTRGGNRGRGDGSRGGRGPANAGAGNNNNNGSAPSTTAVAAD